MMQSVQLSFMEWFSLSCLKIVCRVDKNLFFMGHKKYPRRPCHRVWHPPPLFFTKFKAVPAIKLQLVRHASRGHLLLLAPGLVPFGICICSATYIKTISKTYHVTVFEVRTSLGTFILLSRKCLFFMGHKKTPKKTVSPSLTPPPPFFLTNSKRSPP